MPSGLVASAVSGPPEDERPSCSLEYVHCNLCGADDTDTVFEARWTEDRAVNLDTYRPSGDEALIHPLVRCRCCGHEYVNPRPRAADILRAYSEGDDTAYVSQMAARERTFRGGIARIEAMRPERGRLLDVGTAAGAFLAAARLRGWDVEGCELNRWVAEWGSRHYGLLIRTGQIFEQDFPPHHFDVVTLWDVVEHTPDPARVVAHIGDLLKPHGLLVINYPDRGSWIARLMGRKWPFLSSVHLHYFHTRTMAALLETRGFDVVEWRRHVQWLELDYVLRRAHVSSQLLSRWGRRIVGALGIGPTHVPYWLGQTSVIARRRSAIPHLVAFLTSSCWETIA